jgi:hypothetical protein
MSKTRNGKIARLSRELREQLNRRLDDGEEGQRLVEWLNTLPEVQRVLADQFGGRPISEQNLSEWRQGGFTDWLRHQEAGERVRRLTERAQALDDAADGVEVSDRLTSVLAAELAAAADTLLEDTTDPKERWQRLRELLEELRHLRYADHNSLRVRMEEERWDLEFARKESEDLRRRVKEQKERLLGMCLAPALKASLAKAFGNGESGRKLAELLSCVWNDEPLPDWSKEKRASAQARSEPVQPDPTESNPIKPDQTEGGPIKPGQEDGNAQ